MIIVSFKIYALKLVKLPQIRKQIQIPDKISRKMFEPTIFNLGMFEALPRWEMISTFSRFT